MYTAAVTLDLVEQLMRDAYRKSDGGCVSPRAFALELQCVSVKAMKFLVVCDVPYSVDAFVFAIKNELAASNTGCITRFLAPKKPLQQRRPQPPTRAQRTGAMATTANKKPLNNKRKFAFLSK